MKNTPFTILIAIGYIISSCSGPQSSDEATAWPQFRGKNSSGIASEKSKPPIEFNEKNLLWKTEIPTGHSSPCIWGGNIFISGCSLQDSSLGMFCIDRKKGNIIWQKAILPQKLEVVHAVGNAAQSSPVTDGERVYFYFGSYGLLCYDVSGELIWEKIFPLSNASYGVASSPVIYKELLILSRDVRSEQRLYAFNKFTGDTIWVAELPERSEERIYSSYSTPIIWKNSIIVHRWRQVTAHSVHDGSLEWWISMPTNGNSTPVFQDDILYFGAWHEFSEEDQRGDLPDFKTMISIYDADNDGLITQAEIPEDMILFERPEIRDLQGPFYLRNFFGYFDENEDGVSDKAEWDSTIVFFHSFFKDGGLIALRPDARGELPVSSMIWKVKEKVPEVPSPLFYQELVYMCKNGGILTCMDAKNGNVQYIDRIGAPGPYIASPVAANGYIYFTSANGTITVLKAGRTLDIVKQSKLGEGIYATPTIIGDSFYVRSKEHLFAFQ